MLLWTGEGLFFEGWVNFKRHREDGKGLEQMRDGLDAYNATGTQLYLPYGYAILGACYGISGRLSEGLQVVRQVQTLPWSQLASPSLH